MAVEWEATKETAHAELTKHLDAMPSKRMLHFTMKEMRAPRSTGPHSQNNHEWGHATQIGSETGDTARSVLDGARWDAMTMGYSTKTNYAGKTVPVDLSEQNSKDASILIERLHQIAAFIPVKLIEKSRW